jgi:MYXO-CTERM domain-containing protein
MRRVVLSLLLLCSLAHANGRASLTNGVAFRPGDNDTVYLATTFGLLISHDSGCTFRWVCEQNIGYGGRWDPKYAIAADGTIFATTYEGLRVSRDGGCSFATAASTQNIWVDALDIGPDGRVWIGTATTGHTNDVFVSSDNGMTFQPTGMQSPEIWWKSVEVAPSNPQRVYVTGYQIADSPVAYLFRSDGKEWIPLPLTNVMYAAMPVLVVKAVDPTNPDIAYMASVGANPPSGDRLYRTTDGGMTWTDVLQTSNVIQDVVVKDDRVLVATQIVTAMTLMGGPTYESTNHGESFGILANAPQLACLGLHPDGKTLYGCGANWEPDFKSLARSVDNGATWEKVWRFVEIAGAVQCPEGTVQHDTCETTIWDCPTCPTDLKRQFGAKGPACGVQPEADMTPVKKDGCCAAAAGPSAMWGLTVLALLLRRRRRR